MRIKTTSIYVVWRNHILLIRRAKNDASLPNWWESPGGHVDRFCGYTDNLLCRLEAVRELKEETGIDAKPQMLLTLPRIDSPSHLSYFLKFDSRLPPKVVLSHEHNLYRWDDIEVSPIGIRTPMRHQVRDFILSCRKGVFDVK